VLICWAETVNLSDVNKNFIASEEIGRSISNVPERHYLFGKLKEDFNEVRNKCEMAIDSAGMFLQSSSISLSTWLILLSLLILVLNRSQDLSISQIAYRTAL
jgi:hypothetical protein